MDWKDELIIRYPNGTMSIHMDAFFPASQARIRKLYQVMELSEWPYPHVDEIVDKVLLYIEERDADLSRKKKKAANDMMAHKTAYEEKRKEYRSRRNPSWKEEIQKLDDKWRSDARTFDRAVKEQKRLAQNKELLMSLNGRC